MIEEEWPILGEFHCESNMFEMFAMEAYEQYDPYDSYEQCSLDTKYMNIITNNMEIWKHISGRFTTPSLPFEWRDIDYGP